MSKETFNSYPIHEQEEQYRLDLEENPSSSRRCSLFSDHMEAKKCGISALKTYNSVGFGFHVGDMVWGKVKSHPWWPGHIYNETFASSSVRRTKREGHVLVAFFGDSSYGWFEHAELVHFDSNFFEKSRQTNTKNFVKAVEEAVDEASRRAALGLICCCRNPYNFRSVNVAGHFAVNVLDYDVGIYSSSQIIQARESFRPEKTLDFVKGLALTAGRDSRSIDCIKQKATVLIYRKIVFEEFDETYAQAFGMQPVRPSRELTCTRDPSTGASSRAPLSGPMVFAETGGGDDKVVAPPATKSVKGKSNHKKDRYLFKRRDELAHPKKPAEEHSGQHPTHSSPSLPDPGEENATGSSSSVVISFSNHIPPPSVPENGDSCNVFTVNYEGAGAPNPSPMATGGEESLPESIDGSRISPEPLSNPLLYLKSLALDPFHGTDEDRSSVYTLIFNFRSSVYQKSLVLSPLPENATDQNQLRRTAAAEQDPPPVPAPPPARRLKVPEFRSSDPTKSGRKRGCGGSGEQSPAPAVKKAKKSSDLKQRRSEEGTRGDQIQFKTKKQTSGTGTEGGEPTMLVIKFPGKTAIPSIGELKVKFARFGQLDSEKTRVFWNTDTCRVVFRHEADARAAHKHALESNSLFGNVPVACQLRSFPTVPAREPNHHLHHHHHDLPPTLLKLKSCLKNSAGQTGQTGRAGHAGRAGQEVGRGVSRVKFVIDGEQTECNRSKRYKSEKWSYNNTSGGGGVVEREDISIQMFTLLTRCSEIVTSLKKCLGYVPYRPL